MLLRVHAGHRWLHVGASSSRWMSKDTSQFHQSPLRYSRQQREEGQRCQWGWKETPSFPRCLPFSLWLRFCSALYKTPTPVFIFISRPNPAWALFRILKFNSASGEQAAHILEFRVRVDANTHQEGKGEKMKTSKFSFLSYVCLAVSLR